jgi:hypothetical protein
MAGLPGMKLLSQKPAGNPVPDKPLRVEIPARSVNETYRIISCGTNGLIMFFRSQEAPDVSLVNWYFTCYDTNLQRVWAKSVSLFNDQDFRFSQGGKDTLALLFVHTGKSKTPGNSYEILRVLPQTGTMILNTGTIDEGATVDAFGIVNDRAWLGINQKGQAGNIVSVGLKHGAGKAFPMGIGDQITVLWMQPDSASQTVSAIVSRQVSKKNTEYYLVRYDTNGTIKREVLIGTPTDGRALTQARIAVRSDGDELLLGAYGHGGTSSAQKSRQIEESTGLFSGIIHNGVQKSMTYVNFLELQNAGSVVGEEDIINLKKKAQKKNKSLTEYSLDLSVLLHEILFVHDQYILTAEIFSPQYHTENFTDFDFYGRPYTNSYSVFDGYRFYNAVVAGFDREGKLLWDNTVEIRNLVSIDLSPKVVIFPSGSDLVLCYVSDGKIGSKIIQENNVTEKLDFAAIDLLNPEDKLLSETKGAMIPWYGNYFLSYGYQEIKNVALESNNKRLVYYFSKLRFEK